jgi:hypothetical protein
LISDDSVDNDTHLFERVAEAGDEASIPNDPNSAGA